MNNLLGHLAFVKIYLDDILTASKDRDIHADHVEKVLTILKKQEVFINFDKCNFYQTKVKYLGYNISAEGITPNTTD